MNIVEVVGGPGSGKTTLVHKLLEEWPGTASLLRIDRYLRNRESGDGDDFFLLPTSIDWPLVMSHLDLLAGGTDVIMPFYDWHRGQRQTMPQPPPADHRIAACDWLIIEGLFYVPAIHSVRLFVDAPAEVRRVRTTAHATRLSQSLVGIYDQVAEPAYEQVILPQRDQADYVLDGRVDADTLAQQARRSLASLWTGWG